jgi:nitrite reductase (NADH) small subunit
MSAAVGGSGSVLPRRSDDERLSYLTRPWRHVCDVERLIPDRGAAARVDGCQVAVFRVSSGEVFAIDDVDPFSGAAVLSRGIVGDVDGELTVASPVYKQRFSLRTGLCLDDETVSVQVWDVRVNQGRLEVAVR